MCQWPKCNSHVSVVNLYLNFILSGVYVHVYVSERTNYNLHTYFSSAYTCFFYLNRLHRLHILYVITYVAASIYRHLDNPFVYWGDPHQHCADIDGMTHRLGCRVCDWVARKHCPKACEKCTYHHGKLKPIVLYRCTFPNNEDCFTNQWKKNWFTDPFQIYTDWYLISLSIKKSPNTVII